MTYYKVILVPSRAGRAKQTRVTLELDYQLYGGEQFEYNGEPHIVVAAIPVPKPR